MIKVLRLYCFHFQKSYHSAVHVCVFQMMATKFYWRNDCPVSTYTRKSHFTSPKIYNKKTTMVPMAAKVNLRCWHFICQVAAVSQNAAAFFYVAQREIKRNLTVAVTANRRVGAF